MEIRVLREEELIHASGLSRFVFDACLRNRMEFLQTIPFVEEYISEANLKEYASFANKAASVCVSKRGAINAMPTKEEVR